MNKEMHWYERAAIYANKHFSWIVRIVKDNKKTREKINKYFPPDYIKNLNFTGLEVEPRDILLLSYAGAFISFLSFFIFDLLILFTYGFNIGKIDFYYTYFNALSIFYFSNYNNEYASKLP